MFHSKTKTLMFICHIRCILQVCCSQKRLRTTDFICVLLRIKWKFFLNRGYSTRRVDNKMFSVRLRVWLQQQHLQDPRWADRWFRYHRRALSRRQDWSLFRIPKNLLHQIEIWDQILLDFEDEESAILNTVFKYSETRL